MKYKERWTQKAYDRIIEFGFEFYAKNSKNRYGQKIYPVKCNSIQEILQISTNCGKNSFNQNICTTIKGDDFAIAITNIGTAEIQGFYIGDNVNRHSIANAYIVWMCGACGWK